jgi:hypothetical protein
MAWYLVQHKEYFILPYLNEVKDGWECSLDGDTRNAHRILEVKALWKVLLEDREVDADVALICILGR